MSKPTFTPVELPWHQRLEARVATALGLLVAVALGAMLLVTVGVVSARSRDRVAAELEVARQAFYTLLDIRIASAIDVAELVTQLPEFRAQLSETRPATVRASLDAIAKAHRAQMQAEFLIVSRADGTWLGSAGWADSSGSGVNVVRDAQHAARSGRATGALVQDRDRLFLVVSVPVRAPRTSSARPRSATG